MTAMRSALATAVVLGLVAISVTAPAQAQSRSATTCSAGRYLSGNLTVRNATCATGRRVSLGYFTHTPPARHIGAATVYGWHCSGEIIPVSRTFSKFGIECRKGSARTNFVGVGR